MKTTRKIKLILSFVSCTFLGAICNSCLADQPSHMIGIKPSEKQGQAVFMRRCVLCHGKRAEGDGRMAKVLKSPPPHDLTASRQSDEYLKEIIVKGSEALGRSKHMPPWGEALNEVEIDSVILYIKSIRD